MRTGRSLLGLVGLLLLVTLVVAACGGATATPEPAVEAESSVGEAEAPEDMMEDEDPEPAEDMETPTAEMEKTTSESETDTENSEDSMKEEPQDTVKVEDSEAAVAEEPEVMTAGTELMLEVAGLENLGNGWVYEGWLIVDGAPVSTGFFTVDDHGLPSTTSFDIADEHADGATAFVLTIEPETDPDPAPSAVHVLGGDLLDGSAQLSVGHTAALGNDFAATSASYILGIPSSDSADDSYTSGIWFNSLDLPTLPEGWLYEGWVAGAEGPVSTGRFATDKKADGDGNGPTAGPNAGPSFPGQDYLNPPLDLTSGYAAVISVEPVPDNSPAPFFLKPLVDKDIEDVGDHGSQGMENVASSFPSGNAMLKVMDSAADMETDAMAEDVTEEEIADLPAWFTADLMDVSTGETFTIAGLGDKVLLVETMAIWCSNCLRQQKEVLALHETLGDQEGLVTVVLDIDPNEDADNLRDYAAKHGFDWTYAVAPREVAREIGQLYGDQYLNPPSTPMLIIDQHGEVHLLPFGRKTAEELQLALEPFLSGEM